MYRFMFSTIGFVLTTLPELTVRLFEHLAIANLESVQRRPSMVKAVRVEGLLFSLAGKRGGALQHAIFALLTIGGALAALWPDRALAINARVGYEHSEAIEWNEHVQTAVRIFGLLYVVIGITGWRSHRGVES